MLTQCPECQTTYRLHLKQLRAAGGKVRCSRCHTTFDALDNLVEQPAPAAAPPAAKAETAKQPPATEPVGGNTHRVGPKSRPEQGASGEEGEKGQPLTSALHEPAPDTRPLNRERDAIDELIEELESSTAPRPPEGPATPPPKAEKTELPSDELLHAALESTTAPRHEEIDSEETLPRIETDEEMGLPGVEPLAEKAPVEASGKIEARPEFPLSESEADLYFEEAGPEETETAAASDEPGFESLFEEALPEEPETGAASDEPGFESLFEETLPEEPESGAASDEPGFYPLFEEALPEEPETGASASKPQLDLFFDESEPPAPSVSTETIAEEPEYDPLAHLDKVFDEAPDIIAEPRLAERPFEVPEEPIFAADFGDDLHTPSDEAADGDVAQGPSEPADVQAMDEGALRGEEGEAPTDLSPASPEAQIESMLKLYEAEEAEQAGAREVETVPTSEPEPASGHAPTPDEAPPAAASYAIPTELTQARGGSLGATILWGVGILLLCAGLVLQYLYYFRLPLVENPQLRVVISAMCDITGCKLPPRRDLERIEVAEHLMQFHPTYENSLRLTATLSNGADFDQPYPLVEVIMTDIEQRVVARRHFTPELYLTNYSEGDSFAAHSEVPLLLEVLDPGNRAVGFEFRFY